MHPFEAKSWENTQLTELQNILLDPECVAVGEIGLDYTKEFSPQDIQKSVFEKQVNIWYNVIYFSKKKKSTLPALFKLYFI